MAESLTTEIENVDSGDDGQLESESKKRVLVFNFAMSPPKNLEKYREEQNRLFVRFYNKRIEVERRYFFAREELRGRYSQEYRDILDRAAELDKALTEAYTQVRRRNQKYRSLSATDADRIRVERIYADMRKNRETQWKVLSALNKNEQFKAMLDGAARLLNMRRKLVYNLFGEVGPLFQKLHIGRELTKDEYLELSRLFERIAKDRSKKPIPVDWFNSLRSAFGCLSSNFPLTQEMQEAVDDLRQFLRDEGRPDCEPRAGDYGNLWWGTRAKISRSVELAVKSREKLNLPAKFKRTDEVSPSITTQLQNGITQQEMLSGRNTYLKAEILRTYRGGRNRLAKVLLRVGTDYRNQPVMLESVVRFHRRDWPEEAKIKEVTVTATTSGTKRHFDSQGRVSFVTREKWFMQLTVESPEPVARVSQGVVAVDLGWKVLEDRSIRAATWCGENPACDLVVPDRSALSIRRIGTEDGKEYGELVLLPSMPDYSIPGLLDRQGRCDDLRSIRDRKFGQIVTQIAAARTAGTVPSWFFDRTQTIGTWQSHRRLLAVFAECQNRYSVDITGLQRGWVADGGDPELISWLFHWAEREVHLHQYEAGNRNRLLACRKQLYQDFVVMLRRRFSRVIVNDVNYAERKRKPSAVTQEAVAGRTEYSGLVSSGGLRQMIKSGHRSVDFVTPIGDTLRKCLVCGTVVEAVRPLMVTCSNCGSSADRLCLAAANLLAVGCAPDKPAETDTQGSSRKPKKKKEEVKTKGRWVVRKEPRTQQVG